MSCLNPCRYYVRQGGFEGDAYAYCLDVRTPGAALDRIRHGLHEKAG
jgi:hypothetical protein